MEAKDRQELSAAVVRSLKRMPRSRKDLAVLISLAIVVFALSAWFDVFNKIVAWMYSHDTWQLDELFTVTIYLVFAIALYAWRRQRELLEQTLRRQKAEEEKAQLAPQLERALADVSRLRKLVPMCSVCKRVRDDRGYWDQVEAYMEVNFSTRFDSGICPQCAAKLYQAPTVIQSRAGQ